MNRIRLATWGATLLFLTTACHAEATNIGKPHYCSDWVTRGMPDPGASGVVMLTFTVTTAGSIAGPTVADSSGNAFLDAASLSCVQRWRYKPAMEDGVKPVAAQWSAYIVWNPKVHPMAMQILRDCGRSIAQKQHVAARRETEFQLTYDKEKMKFSAVTPTHPSGDDALDRLEADCLAQSSAARFETVVVLARPLAEPYPDTFSASMVFPEDGTSGFEVAGNTYLSRGVPWNWPESDKEVGDMEAAIKPRPDDVELRKKLAFAYMRGKQFAQADDDLQAAIKLNPNDAELYFQRGVNFHLWGQADKAVDLFGAAIKLKPDYAQAYEFRGMTYVRLNKLELARGDFDEALRLTPSSEPLLSLRASVRGLLHDQAGALDDYSKAIALKPKAENYCGRAMTYLALKDYASASKDFDMAASLKPDSCSSSLSAEAHARDH